MLVVGDPELPLDEAQQAQPSEAGDAEQAGRPVGGSGKEAKAQAHAQSATPARDAGDGGLAVPAVGRVLRPSVEERGTRPDRRRQRAGHMRVLIEPAVQRDDDPVCGGGHEVRRRALSEPDARTLARPVLAMLGLAMPRVAMARAEGLLLEVG